MTTIIIPRVDPPTPLAQQALHRLATTSYLQLWSYPDVYRLRRAGPTDGLGERLCDLLVVFGDDVLVVAGSSSTYREQRDVSAAWRRWYRLAVERTSRRLITAMRWLERQPGAVYANPACTEPLPVTLPDRPRFHLILVATGARAACERHYGVEGALGLRTDIVGSAHYADGSPPFLVGRTHGDHFVHVVDDATLEEVMTQLDTAADFVRYLSEKEAYLARRPIRARNELALLGRYMKQIDASTKLYRFPPGQMEPLDAAESWEQFLAGPSIRSKTELDEASYVWDGAIRRLAKGANLRSGMLCNVEAGAVPPVSPDLIMLRAMAETMRVDRRMLGQSMLDVPVLCTRGGKGIAARTIRLPGRDDIAYVFVALRYDGGGARHYTALRTSLGAFYGRLAKLREPSLARALVVVLDSRGTDGFPEDILLTDFSLWTEAQDAETRELAISTGLGGSFPAIANWQEGGHAASRQTQEPKRLKRHRRAKRSGH